MLQVYVRIIGAYQCQAVASSALRAQRLRRGHEMSSGFLAGVATRRQECDRLEGAVEAAVTRCGPQRRAAARKSTLARKGKASCR